MLAKQPSTVAAPTGLVDLDPAQLPAGESLEPLRERHGFKGAAICPCRPGEAAALAQLNSFCDGPLLGYEPDRNFPGTAGTSYLSAALSVGTLSPRQAWCAAQDSREQARSEEHLQAIAVWEQELGWREFYQQALFHFPELADGPYREQWRRFPWENNEDWFDFWKEGQTGMPIIDAAMRQLNQTGWMHNRCRMIVASYLVKDLICDWRLGERAFMELEVDGDLAANNGGWQWSASSGMDPKPLRIFNPATQAAKFDSAGDYIRRWVPELRHVNTKDLLSGEIGASNGATIPYRWWTTRSSRLVLKRFTPPFGPDRLRRFGGTGPARWAPSAGAPCLSQPLAALHSTQGRSAGSAPGCRAVP